MFNLLLPIGTVSQSNILYPLPKWNFLTTYYADSMLGNYTSIASLRMLITIRIHFLLRLHQWCISSYSPLISQHCGNTYNHHHSISNHTVPIPLSGHTHIHLLAYIWPTWIELVQMAFSAHKNPNQLSDQVVMVIIDNGNQELYKKASVKNLWYLIFIFEAATWSVIAPLISCNLSIDRPTISVII